MGNGKHPEAPPTIEGADTSDSLAQRIASSASSLLQSSFSQPSAGAVAAAFGSLQSDAGKGSSASSSSATFAETSVHASSSSNHDDPPASSRQLVGEAFRSKHHERSNTQQAQKEFDDFSDPQKLGHSRELAPSPQDSNGPCNETAPPRLEVANEASDSTNRRSSDQRTQIRGSDGSAVVALLSDPSCSADQELSSSWERGDAPVDLQNGQLPRVLDLDKASGSQLEVNPLDLIPDFEGQLSSETTEIERNALLMRTDSSTPWYDILNIYHDEVWGDKLPLVQQARKELKEAEGSGQGNIDELPAVRRLGMLIRHLERSNGT